MKAQATIESMISIMSIAAFTALLLGAQSEWKEKSVAWEKRAENESMGSACSALSDNFLNNAQSEFNTVLDCNQTKPTLHEKTRIKKSKKSFSVDFNGLRHYEP